MNTQSPAEREYRKALRRHVTLVENYNRTYREGRDPGRDRASAAEQAYTDCWKALDAVRREVSDDALRSAYAARSGLASAS